MRSRWVVAIGIAIAGAVAVVLVVATRGDNGDSAGESSGGDPVIVSIGEAIAGLEEGARTTVLSLEVARNGEDPQVLTGDGVMAGSEVELTVDGSKAINEAGIFGEFESFGAAFSGTDAFFEVLPSVPSWLAISLQEASRTEGGDIAQLRELMLANPNVLLTLFKRVDAEGPVGPNDIDGEPMARFDIPVNMGRAWPPAVQPLADVLLEDYGIEDLEVHLWIDADNRLRRIEEVFTYPLAFGADPDVEVSVTIDLSAEASDETPELPDEGDVRSLDDMSA